jgi:hypothetical protein
MTDLYDHEPPRPVETISSPPPIVRRVHPESEETCCGDCRNKDPEIESVDEDDKDETDQTDESDDEPEDDIPDYLNCAVCREVLFHPITLSCQHNFCSPCLAKHESKQHNNVYRCMICRLAYLPSCSYNRDLDTVIKESYPIAYRHRQMDYDLEKEDQTRDRRLNERIRTALDAAINNANVANGTASNLLRMLNSYLNTNITPATAVKGLYNWSLFFLIFAVINVVQQSFAGGIVLNSDSYFAKPSWFVAYAFNCCILIAAFIIRYILSLVMNDVNHARNTFGMGNNNPFGDLMNNMAFDRVIPLNNNQIDAILGMNPIPGMANPATEGLVAGRPVPLNPNARPFVMPARNRGNPPANLPPVTRQIADELAGLNLPPVNNQARLPVEQYEDEIINVLNQNGLGF